jgi:hypothetical protein
MFILTKIGLKKFNFFTISQFAYGFSKSGHGSREFWNQIAENYINNSNKIDNLGIAILINSIGRSNEGRLSTVLPTFKSIIL